MNPHPEYEHVGVDVEGMYSDVDVDMSDKAKLGKDHKEEYIPSSDSDEEDSEYDFSDDVFHFSPSSGCMRELWRLFVVCASHGSYLWCFPFRAGHAPLQP